MEFILDKGMKEGTAPCAFCRLREESPGEKSLILYRGKSSYIVMNRFPYANGHLLICSDKHSAEIGDLTPAAQQETMQLVDASMRILRNVLQAEGFNCGLNFGRVAGAGILDHFHFHVVPRWNGDINFLPILSDTKCMPEYLETTYNKLKGEFEKI